MCGDVFREFRHLFRNLAILEDIFHISRSLQTNRPFTGFVGMNTNITFILLCKSRGNLSSKGSLSRGEGTASLDFQCNRIRNILAKSEEKHPTAAR